MSQRFLLPWFLTGLLAFTLTACGGDASPAPGGPGAVSYTHLDVYKRQLPSWRYTDEGREPGLYEMDRRAVFTSPDVTRNENTMATFRLDHAFDEASRLHLLAYHRLGHRNTVNGDLSSDYEDYVEAVSYTHLDVYKRQP